MTAQIKRTNLTRASVWLDTSGNRAQESQIGSVYRVKTNDFFEYSVNTLPAQSKNAVEGQQEADIFG
jgi:hypothetical protein